MIVQFFIYFPFEMCCEKLCSVYTVHTSTEWDEKNHSMCLSIDLLIYNLVNTNRQPRLPPWKEWAQKKM